MSAAQLGHLEAAWRDYLPPPDALHTLTPYFCYFAGLSASQAQAFAGELVELIERIAAARSTFLSRAAFQSRTAI